MTGPREDPQTHYQILGVDEILIKLKKHTPLQLGLGSRMGKWFLFKPESCQKKTISSNYFSCLSENDNSLNILFFLQIYVYKIRSIAKHYYKYKPGDVTLNSNIFKFLPPS